MVKQKRTVWKCDYCVAESDNEETLPCFLITVGDSASPNVCPESGIHGIVANWKRLRDHKELIDIIKGE